MTSAVRSAPAGAAAASSKPRIWLVLGDKVGDNRQVERVAEALAEELGESFELRSLRFRKRWQTGKPPFLPALYHVDMRRSDSLLPPWPDLVLTIGRRPAMAALWIRRRSGNRTRIVLFGRPKRFFDDFALVVAPAQYGLPERDSVVRLGLPLIRLDPARVAEEAERWRERLADLPRPLTVLLVGGRTKPYRMDADVAREIVATTLAGMPPGGGLFVSTSRRTPAAVVEALREALPPGARLHGFAAAEPGSSDDNPYLGLLGLGDRFVVTGDSVSMLTEIARLRRPLVIHALPREASAAGRWQDALRAPGAGRLRSALASTLASAAAWLREQGLVGWPRDLEALHALLVARGWARRAGAAEATSAAPSTAPPAGPSVARGADATPEDEIDLVVQRIRALLIAPTPSGRDAT